ncbi:TrkH family potassium uptake protein [Corynebacterium sp. ES2794-CONJ1]|uniref:TrkH family potassium uptake protein n=1 Tax=unclassified Corynebacterium TaxID=2624378 RepID=UPI00216B437A|nr:MULTISPECIES: potassium transporter TrkG [unclassified Corynebacterium]MCS4531579.1 TrkH family potassium uptake protein [Corynebacterium sp. ES2730-CONJ]MCU9518975.1 TrkH family potassium uptake protein [Corynebacterium sp. ES2794-CONJ1]
MRRFRRSPARLVAESFLGLIVLGTVLLSMPFSHATEESSILVSLFTATSAVCLTGLVVVDTATYWTHLGQLIIIGLVQLGGLGIMTLATLASWAIAGRMGVRSRLNASAEGRGLHLGEVKGLLAATIGFTLVVEIVVAMSLSLRFYHHYGLGVPAAIWEGSFHAISAFNNAGFGLASDNLVPYVRDEVMLWPIALAIILGGLGFPTLLELAKRVRTRGHLSLTTIFTLYGTAILLSAGMIVTAFFEWNGALAHLSPGDKLFSAFFHSVSSRTAGFNSIDLSMFHPNELMATNILMLIGGGSGGTAGGVKITTVGVLVAVLIAEIKGDDEVAIYGRKLPDRTLRQALAVVTIAAFLVFSSIMIVIVLAPDFATDQLVFEVISAFSTVGLSTGITSALPQGAQIVLIILMYAGRIGPITVVAALAARDQQRHYSFPEERPFIG